METYGLPFPENAPELGACVRIERPKAGLAVVMLDPPHRSLAVLDAPLIRDLEAAVTELESTHGLNGIVFAGAKPLKFAAGADINAIESITSRDALLEIVLQVHALFARIAALRPRTVAAVGGPVPGGAFELSLSCDYIVAADDKKTKIGLPETMLGIIPGWGGPHRLPRRIGLPAATQAILTGRLYPVHAALKLGMIDRATQPERLLAVASKIALGAEALKCKERSWKYWAVDRNPLAVNLIMRKAREMVLSKTRGNYPAPLRAIDLLAESLTTSLEDSARKEAEAIADLGSSSVCKALISIFHASEEAKKLGRKTEDFTPQHIEHAGVLGSGIMGAGIASSFANRGVATRLFDLAPGPLDTALHNHRKEIAKRLKRRRLQKHEALAASDHLDTTREMIGFGNADLIIEAVAERLDVKLSVFQKLAKQVSSDCILATNTSSLSVTEIASGIPHPERIVGMHFFNPVKKMPLVEIVLGKQTSREVALSAAALAVRLGKTPVLVKDVAGFLINRLLAPYLDEAVRLFVAGVSPRRIDRLMLDFGIPMGPLRLLDEVGLDIADRASTSLHAAYGMRMEPCTELEAMRSPDRLGRKTGRGFYTYTQSTGKRNQKEVLATDLARFQANQVGDQMDDEEIVDRLVLSMLNEGVRALEEQVVESAIELDLATVFGMGFAPFHGGLLHYADRIGAKNLVSKLENIADTADASKRVGGREKFTPAKRLQEMARNGSRFFG
ncbi:MAG: 3-hydroxyacyl-CoA dehydrogenase NAD-binding domain-containing protein [Planctomycetes bacterium]|nr:3-hydroxyacyl-CoA dehydrogenase NAD-binding domain-containing protein [Planctomycetota bacterium]